MVMDCENEQQELYDVVELLLKYKEEILESLRWYMIKFIEKEKTVGGQFLMTFNDEFKETVLRELRLFAINKLNITAENAMAYIDDDLLDICPELEFYFEKETYYGNI